MAEVDPDRARAQARTILEGAQYQERDVPRPLQGALRWLGERLGDLFRPLLDLLATPVGVGGALALAAALTAVGVLLVARRRIRLAAAAEEDHRVAAAGADPRALDREAEGAEAAGDLALAVRLRFRAGMLRLARAGVAPARRSAPTGRLLAEVPSPALGPLAVAFDEIAYGGRPATDADVAAARAGWPQVLRDVGAR